MLPPQGCTPRCGVFESGLLTGPCVVLSAPACAQDRFAGPRTGRQGCTVTIAIRSRARTAPSPCAHARLIALNALFSAGSTTSEDPDPVSRPGGGTIEDAAEFVLKPTPGTLSKSAASACRRGHVGEALKPTGDPTVSIFERTSALSGPDTASTLYAHSAGQGPAGPHQYGRSGGPPGYCRRSGYLCTLMYLASERSEFLIGRNDPGARWIGRSIQASQAPSIARHVRHRTPAAAAALPRPPDRVGPAGRYTRRALCRGRGQSDFVQHGSD